MKKKQLIQSCLCVNRQSMMLYSSELIDLSVISLTSEIIQDLEIVSQSALERVIRNLLTQSNIQAKTLAIYFAEENYFFKDLKDIAGSDDPQIKYFLENIPFNQIITKIFPMQGGSRITAINKSLLRPLIAVLEKCGFTVLAAVPAFVIGVNTENPFSKEIAKQSLKNQDLFRVYNFIEPEEIEAKLAKEKSFLSVEINKKLVMMIAFLLILISVLIVLLISRRS